MSIFSYPIYTVMLLLSAHFEEPTYFKEPFSILKTISWSLIYLLVFVVFEAGQQPCQLSPH